MIAKLYIDQRTDGSIYVDDQQGEYGPYVLWEDHQAEVERLTKDRDDAQAEVERLKDDVEWLTFMRDNAEKRAHERCISLLRLKLDLMRERELRRSKTGLLDAIEMLNRYFDARETEDTP